MSETTIPPPACVNCRWIELPQQYRLSRCTHPRARDATANDETDVLVLGKPREESIAGWCMFARQIDGACGPHGLLFEPRVWTGRMRKGPNGELIPTLEPDGVPGGCALMFLAPFLGVLAALLCGGVR